MSEENALNNLEIKNRIKELKDIIKLYENFGNSSFDLVERYNVSLGFETGYKRIFLLLKNNEFNKATFYENPVKIISEFLYNYFKDRGGNLPQVWRENNVIYLKTEFAKSCPTYEAEKSLPVPHCEICNIYCRSFVKGLLSVFVELFPGVKINFFNKSSRRSGDDCVEGFQIICP